jgi:hypothetical protein
LNFDEKCFGSIVNNILFFDEIEIGFTVVSIDLKEILVNIVS